MKKLLMAMALMPMVALADKETVDGIEWTYTVKDGKAQIIAGPSSKTTGTVTIPSTLGGCPVTSIGQNEFRSGFGCRVFEKCGGLTSVTIPSSVTSIGDSAFYGCSNLTTVTIPSSVTNIGRCAFSTCSDITSFSVDEANTNYSSRNGLLCSKDGTILVAGVNGGVTIPPCVTKVGDSAFRGFGGLKSVKIPPSVKTISHDAFSHCSGLSSVVIPASVNDIGQYAFSGCSGLMSFFVDEANAKYSSRNGLLCSKDGSTVVFGVNGDVIIPSGVRRIGRYAFYGCDKLRKVTIPKGVTHIEYYAFRSCGELRAVTIPEGVTSIGMQAFSGCEGLTSIAIPSSVTEIGVSAFTGCIGLKSFTVDEANAEYSSRNGLLCSKDGAVLIAGVNGDVTIPPCVTNIGENAFCWCGGLTSVTVPLSVTKIGDFAFDGCRGLISLTIPPSVKRIGCRAFEMCSGLKSVTISEGVTSIGEYAFAWCDEIESVSLPQSVTNIGECSFCECRGLNSVEIPSSVASVGVGAFYECSGLKSIVIPSSVTSIGRGAFSDTPFYDNMPDGLVILGGGVLYKYKGECPSAVTIPSNVTSIGENAFLRCGELESVTIPSSVTNVDGRAFVDCKNLKTVHVERDGKMETMPFGDYFKQWKNVVAQRLRKCDFLLNGDFKKDAKYYLCLFSASWCGPCRKEMPRIAKAYAEALKADPDIELIHFSCDQNDDRALAWAKEHEVKFPVVRPDGGNPLGLEADGIPHLFIVKADGTLVEEGHPNKLFTDEKLRAITGKGLTQAVPSDAEAVRATGNDVKWTYEVVLNGVVLGGKGKTAVPKDTAGALVVPDAIDGKPVRGIGEGAFRDCQGVTAITIPASVTSIGKEAFVGCHGLASVTIPSGVTRIEWAAFRGCRGLKSVAIPPSVTRIDGTALCDCGALTSVCVDDGNPVYKSENGLLLTKDGRTLVRGVNGDVKIPAGVECVGRFAFEGCAELKSVAIPQSVREIAAFAFKNCAGLKSVTIPSGVVSIGQEAFFGCNGLESLTIPQGVRDVCDSAFRLCSGLKSLTIQPGVSRIGRSAFRQCHGLVSVEIPSSVTSLGLFAFDDCHGLVSLSVDSANPAYSSKGGLVFSKDGLVLLAGVNGDVVIPEGVTSIGRESFHGCTTLKTVTVPASVTHIGDSALSYCGELTSVTMRGERPAASDEAMAWCGKLASIHVPAKAKSWAGMTTWQGVPIVFDEEVDGCTWSYLVKDGEATVVAEASGRHSCAVSPKPVGRIAVPSTLGGCPVTGVGSGAFGGCSNLTSVTIPACVKNIGGQDRLGTRRRLLSGRRRPFAAGEREREPFGSCSGLMAFDVDSANEAYSSPNGLLCSKDGQVLLCGVNGNVTIPSSVTGIVTGAFRECGGIQSFSVGASNPSYSSRNWLLCSKDGSTLIMGAGGDVVIPEGVADIRNSAFSGCGGLTSVTIPPSVTNIGANAFSGCSGLSSVTMPSSVTNIGCEAFGNCPNLKSVDVVRDGKVEAVPLEEFRKTEERPRPRLLGRRMGSLRERRALRDRQRAKAAKAAAEKERIAAEKEVQREAERAAERAQREAEREAQRAQLLQIQEELRKSRMGK